MSNPVFRASDSGHHEDVIPKHSWSKIRDWQRPRIGLQSG